VPAAKLAVVAEIVVVTELQRRRSRALAVAMLALAALGAFLSSGLLTSTAAPPPCPAPAVATLGAVTPMPPAAGLRRVLVCDGNGAPAGGHAWLAGQKLDVNRASVHDLEDIPGIGESLAHAIVSARDARGSFKSLDELDDVAGIGPKTLEKLARFIEVR
jgi:competence protein ComEA